MKSSLALVLVVSLVAGCGPAGKGEPASSLTSASTSAEVISRSPSAEVAAPSVTQPPTRPQTSSPTALPRPTPTPTPKPAIGPGAWASVGWVDSSEGVSFTELGGRALPIGADCADPTGATALSGYDQRMQRMVEIRVPPGVGDTWTLAAPGDGRLMIVGGTNEDRVPTSSTWIWAPANGAWVEGPHMTLGRASPAVAVLSDGRVLVAGGDLSAGGPPVSTRYVEIYDPSTDRWTLTGELPRDDLFPDLVPLGEGRALALPGEGDHPDPLLYDPEDGRWNAVPPPDGVVLTAPLVALPDGTALAIGGTMRFDPASGWRTAGRLREAREEPAAAALPDGRVLVAGGSTVSELASMTAELLDPDSGISSPVAPMPIARADGFAVTLADGSILVAGGYAGYESRGGSDDTQKCPPVKYWAIRWVP